MRCPSIARWQHPPAVGAGPRAESNFESAPVSLKHRAPFQHDLRNGEMEAGMGHPTPKYAVEFKQRAVQLYRERGGVYAGLSRELGVEPGGISDWVRRA